MKTQKLLLMFSLLTLAASASAMADVRQGWDRSMYKADMSVIEQQGGLPQAINGAKSIELVMTHQDGTTSPVGFVLLIDGQFNQAYQVSNVAKDLCNTVIYTLTPVQQDESLVLSGSNQVLHVTDNSARTCMDLVRYRWELNVKNVDLLTKEVLGQAQLAGNPEPVMTSR